MRTRGIRRLAVVLSTLLVVVSTLMLSQVSAQAVPELNLTVDPEGIASPVTGEAIVQITLTCTEPAVLTMYGTVTQVVKQVIVRGQIFFYQLNCTPETPFVWTAYVSPDGTTPFEKGDAEVHLSAGDFFGGGSGVETRMIVSLSKK